MRKHICILLVSWAVASCESDRTAAPTSVDEPHAVELSTSDGYWYCSEFSGHPEHFIDHCYMEVMVDASRIATWNRIGCFGEFSYTQVDEGNVREFPNEFMVVVDGHERHWPSPFKVFAFAYFPEAHKALDPTLEWYQCKVIDVGDDLTVPERPTH